MFYPSSDSLQVLDVDPVRLKLTLTHKRTLVESKLPVLSSYDSVKVGEVHHGFIRAINDWGCVVYFFNHVKGIVNRSDLGFVCVCVCVCVCERVCV